MAETRWPTVLPFSGTRVAITLSVSHLNRESAGTWSESRVGMAETRWQTVLPFSGTRVATTICQPLEQRVRWHVVRITCWNGRSKMADGSALLRYKSCHYCTPQARGQNHVFEWLKQDGGRFCLTRVQELLLLHMSVTWTESPLARGQNQMLEKLKQDGNRFCLTQVQELPLSARQFSTIRWHAVRNTCWNSWNKMADVSALLRYRSLRS
jgi:hypothetical protein